MPFRYRRTCEEVPPPAQPPTECRQVVNPDTGLCCLEPVSTRANLPDPFTFTLSNLIKAGVKVEEVNTRVIDNTMCFARDVEDYLLSEEIKTNEQNKE